MRSYRPGFMRICLSFYHVLLSAILDPGLRLITFSSNFGNSLAMENSACRPKLEWCTVGAIASISSKMESRRPTRDPSTPEAPPKFNKQVIDRQMTIASTTPPRKLESPPPLPGIHVFYSQTKDLNPTAGSRFGVEQTHRMSNPVSDSSLILGNSIGLPSGRLSFPSTAEAFRGETAITREPGHSLPGMNFEDWENYFEALNTDYRGLRSELGQLGIPVTNPNLEKNMCTFIYTLSSVLDQINASIKQCQLRLETRRLGTTAGEVDKPRLADQEGTLTTLTECMLQLQKQDAVDRPKQERFVFMVLGYLLERNLIQTETVLDMFRGDPMMLLTVRHIVKVMLPMHFFYGDQVFCHELQSSWRYALQSHTKLKYLRPFLKAFNNSDWSRFLLHFLVEHYRNDMFQDKSLKVLPISVVLDSFRELNSLQSTRIPPVHWITLRNVHDTISLFDRPIQGVDKSKLDSYIASYHLLEYMLTYAHPGLINTLMTMNVMNYSIWMKRGMLKAMLQLADTSRVFLNEIRSSEHLEHILAISKTVKEQEETYKILTSQYSTMKTAAEKFKIHKNEKYPGIQRFLAEATNTPEFQACSHEIQNWIESNLNSLIFTAIVGKIRYCLKCYEEFLKYQPSRLANAKVFS